MFAFTFSTDRKWVPLSTGLIFRKRQKSRERGQPSRVGAQAVMFLLAKNCFTGNALWAGALSWCKIHTFLHNSGRFLLKLSRNFVKTSM